MKNRKLLNVLLMILPAAAVVLTALPNCVMMKFAAPEPESAYIAYCSGFSMLPPGYGNWGPMLAGLSSAVLSVLGIVRAVKESDKIAKWMFGMAVFAVLMSLVSLLFGSMTFIGILIAVILAAETALLYFMRKD